jgi:hypothetical protein
MSDEIKFSLNKVVSGYVQLPNPNAERPGEFMRLNEGDSVPPFICQLIDDCSSATGECYDTEEDCLAACGCDCGCPSSSSSSSSYSMPSYYLAKEKLVPKIIENPSSSSSEAPSFCDSCAIIDERYGSGSGQCTPSGNCYWSDDVWSINVTWTAPGTIRLTGGCWRGDCPEPPDRNETLPVPVWGLFVDAFIDEQWVAAGLPPENPENRSWSDRKRAASLSTRPTWSGAAFLDQNGLGSISVQEFDVGYINFTIADDSNGDFSSPNSLIRSTVIRTSAAAPNPRWPGAEVIDYVSWYEQSMNESKSILDQAARAWLDQMDQDWQNWLASGGTNWPDMLNQWGQDIGIDEKIAEYLEVRADEHEEWCLQWPKISEGVPVSRCESNSNYLGCFCTPEDRQKFIVDYKRKTIDDSFIVILNSFLKGDQYCSSGPWSEFCEEGDYGSGASSEPGLIVPVPTAGDVQNYGLNPPSGVLDDSVVCIEEVDEALYSVIGGPFERCPVS